MQRPHLGNKFMSIPTNLKQTKQSRKMTPELDSTHNKQTELVLEIFRESGVPHSLNRYVRNPATKEILYSVIADETQTIKIYKGDKHGPLIATAHQCLERDGITEIHITDTNDTIRFQHIHELLPFFDGKTLFEIAGKKYHWKGQTALIDDQTGDLLAAFHSKFLETDYHKLGDLVVTEEGQRMLDLVIVGCLVLQERSEEGRLAKEMAKRSVFEATGGLVI